MSAAAPETLTLRQAAERLGVHYMTVYRYVRLGTLGAEKVGGSWRVDAGDLARLRTWDGAGSPDRSMDQASGAVVTPGTPRAPGRRRQAPWAERLRLRMLAGDIEGSWQVMASAMASGMSPADVHVEMVGPALHAVGAAWRRGDLGIEQEHLASSVASSLVGRLGPRFSRRGRSRGSIVVAMPTGERHGLGAAMLSDILRGEGYAVLNLGPDTPPRSLASAMAAVSDLRGVLVSVADIGRLSAAKRLIAAARMRDPSVVVIAGGFAVADEDVARALGADGWAADPRRLVAVMDGLRAPSRSILGSSHVRETR
jgi:MerR family transcriptional regulator, light-induced transcriptional regulator